MTKEEMMAYQAEIEAREGERRMSDIALKALKLGMVVGRTGKLRHPDTKHLNRRGPCR